MYSRLSRRFLVLAVLGFCSVGALAVPDQRSPRIVNGLNTHGFPTTGALMYALWGGNITENNAGSWCSGTLIGCETFLTAAHCVEDDFTPSHYWVFLQHGGIKTVTSVTTHPRYTSNAFPEFDVAVLKLGSVLTGIDPAEINTSMSPPFGTPGTIVGFGQTSGSGGDYGIKRFGQVATSDCTGVAGGGLGNTELVCWRFTEPVGDPGDDSNTCHGDSGGPLLVDLGLGEVVAGVTSGGNSEDCLIMDDSYDANVYTYGGFILGELGMDSTSACGGLPVVGDSAVEVIGNQGTLGNAHRSDTITLSVGGTPSELRVTLNGEDNGSLDVDFYVKEGLGASTSDFDCKSDGNANVGACTFSSPNPGEWSVFVNRASGSGEYQVTATIFAGDPPECGNNLKESGEDCDGSDDAACAGLCQVDCSCPPPFCGNKVIEIGEECDGTNPGSCPTGVCDPDCTCQDPFCGNNIREAGEECDGTDDAECTGACVDCACPTPTCSQGDLFVLRGTSNHRAFKWRAEIDNFSGTYDGLDPRNQFLFTVTQGPNSVTVDIPPGDPGWERSEPERGRYRWRGLLDGIKSIRVVDRSLRNGVWIVRVWGRAVPGADLIDVIAHFADAQVTMDGICAEGEY